MDNLLGQIVNLLGGNHGKTYVSQRPENLGVQYQKFGPLSVMQSGATPNSKRLAQAARSAGVSPMEAPKTVPGTPYQPRPDLRQAYQQYGDVLIPNDPNSQANLLRRLQMRPQPLYRKWEDGALKLGDTYLPAYDSIDDFTGRRY